MKKLLVIGWFFLNACTTQYGLVGTWKSGSYTVWERGNAFLGGNFLSEATELILNIDSTWNLTGPCQAFKGRRWSVNGDSLYLFSDTTWFINKRAQQSKPPTLTNGRYRAYKIRPGKLINRFHARYYTIELNDSLTWHNARLTEILRMKN